MFEGMKLFDFCKKETAPKVNEQARALYNKLMSPKSVGRSIRMACTIWMMMASV